MFTKVSAFDEPKECYCLSTDTKPLDVPNGSFCVEMDTGKGRERRLLRMLCMTAGSGGGGGDKPWEEMTWDDVIAATKNGKYKEFEIGAMKELDLGSEGIVHMQIVGIDVDDLWSGTGKAPLTFLSKELLKTSHRMNPTNSGNAEGTGTIGGWEKCEMRAYLKETIKPLIPATVRSEIKEVTKYTRIYTASPEAAVNDVATTEDVWIPSRREMSDGTTKYYETKGPRYSEIFSSNDSRKKSNVGATSASYWWLRSAYTNSTFSNVSSAGNYGHTDAHTSYGVALGFCL